MNLTNFAIDSWIVPRTSNPPRTTIAQGRGEFLDSRESNVNLAVATLNLTLIAIRLWFCHLMQSFLAF